MAWATKQVACMKLRNKIAWAVVATVAVSALVISMLINLAFNQSFLDFLKAERQFEFEQIKTDITKIIVSRGYALLSSDLDIYAESSNIYIELLDENKKSLGVYNGLKESRVNNASYVEEIEPIKTSDSTISMRIGYISNEYSFNQRATDFRDNIIQSAFFTGLLGIAVGLAISVYLSDNLSKPIIQITNATKDIRAGKYDTPIGGSDIIEIQDLSNNIRFLSSSLKAQEAIRKHYAQDISHELRTPLTNLQLHLEAIRDGIITMDQETTDILIGEIQRLNTLVNQLKNTFNEGQTQVKIDSETFNLTEELAQINLKLQPRLAENNVELLSTLQEDVIVTMDRGKITQVMYNLITNAVKALRDNGKIQITLNEFPTNVVITVRDNGIGIAEKDLLHIFDRFFQVDPSRNETDKGTGLGLSITRTFIDAMGGKISVLSKVGEGTEFIVELPK